MKYHTSLPETGFVRLRTVLGLIPVGKSTWWEGVKTGRFPKPVKLGERITAWKAEDIRSLIEQSATSPDNATTPAHPDKLGV